MGRGSRLKAEPKAGLLEMVKNGLTFLPDLVLSPVFSRLNSETDVILDKVQRTALQLQDRLISKLASSFFFGVAMLFFFLAGLFYLTDEMKVPKSLAFLGMGVLIFLIGFYFKYQDLKQTKGG